MFKPIGLASFAVMLGACVAITDVSEIKKNENGDFIVFAQSGGGFPSGIHEDPETVVYRLASQYCSNEDKQVETVDLVNSSESGTYRADLVFNCK
jgi:hypothetical protein